MLPTGDIIITIPKTTDWKTYQKELDAVVDGQQVMNFKVSQLPSKARVGDRCYLCYNNQIIGWMEIVGLSEKEFECTTTGDQMIVSLLRDQVSLTDLISRFP